jgi:hypothetical protein
MMFNYKQFFEDRSILDTFTGMSAVNLTCIHVINEQIVQALRYLACIPDVLGSNLGRD